MNICIYIQLTINIHKVKLEVVFVIHFKELLLSTLKVPYSDSIGFPLLSVSTTLKKWLSMLSNRFWGRVCGHILSYKGFS